MPWVYEDYYFQIQMAQENKKNGKPVTLTENVLNALRCLARYHVLPNCDPTSAQKYYFCNMCTVAIGVLTNISQNPPNAVCIDCAGYSRQELFYLLSKFL